MSTEAQLQAVLYRALTGGRLSARTETVGNAIAAVNKATGGGKHAADAVGVSRETWRRWNLPPGAHLSQRPGPVHTAGLMAALRRLRIAPSRYARILDGKCSALLFNRYTKDPRDTRWVNSRSLQWNPAASAEVLQDFVTVGIEEALNTWFDLGVQSDHFKTWMHWENTTDEGYDVLEIDMTRDVALTTTYARGKGRRGRRAR